MKSIKLLFSMIFLLVSSGFAQDMSYVHSQNGDTLVVKDDIEFGATNTLYNLMVSDSMAPASRVYVLQDGGIYSIVNNPVTSSTQRTIIMGQTTSSLKTSQGAPPPILSGSYETGVNTSGGINVSYDLLIKNCDIEIGNSSGTIGWGFFNFNGGGNRIQIDNCIVEHNWWTIIGGPPANSRIFFTNDYLVNLDGHTCRRNGGVLDFFSAQDTIWVENTTHVNTQGSLWKFRFGDPVNKVVFNHNDFINNAGYCLMNNGDVTNMSVTNNVFVNSQLQAFCSVLSNVDVGEVDPDGLPMGLINVRVDSVFNARGKNFYADKNLAYWDASLSDIVSTLNTNAVNGATDWVSQMIPMNDRTAALFADKTNYPLLTNGTWILNQMPTFTETSDLFSTQLPVVKAFAIATVDTTYGSPMASWRQAGNEEGGNFIYADWPIPVDLSYSDADLMTAGLGGFPVGDLGWFPSEYQSWWAQRDAEYDHIAGVLDGTVAVKELPVTANRFELGQNYPNPFNPSTVISYSIPQASNVTLKVYDILGNEVATLVNQFQNANSYKVNFNAASLASGVYIYKIEAGSFTMSKKMLLLK